MVAVVCSGDAVAEAKSGRCEAAAIVLSLSRTIADTFGLDPTGAHLVPVCIQKCSPERAPFLQFAIVCRLADKRHLEWVVQYAQRLGIGGAQTTYPPEYGTEPRLLWWDNLTSLRLHAPHAISVPVGCWRWKRAPQPQPPGMGFFDNEALVQHRYTCAELCGVALVMLDSASLVAAQLRTGRAPLEANDVFRVFLERHERQDLTRDVTWHLAKVEASALSLQMIVLSLAGPGPPEPQRKRVYTRAKLLSLREEWPCDGTAAPAAPAGQEDHHCVPIIDHAAWEADAALDLEEDAMADIYEDEVLKARRRAEHASFDDEHGHRERNPARRRLRSLAKTTAEAALAAVAAPLDVVAHRADLKARAAMDLLALRNAFHDDVWGNGGAAWAYEYRAAAGWAAESERARVHD